MSKPEFVYVTYIETTPEKLWEALTKRVQQALLVRHRSEVGLEGRFALCAGHDGKTTDTGRSSKPIARGASYTFKHELYEAMREPHESRSLEPMAIS